MKWVNCQGHHKVQCVFEMPVKSRNHVVNSSCPGKPLNEHIRVGHGDGQPSSSTMSSKHLLEARMVTVASPAYLAEYGRPVSPQELSKHHCIQLNDAQGRRPFEWQFHKDPEEVKVKVKGSITLHDCDTIVRACTSGAGIAHVLALGNEHWLADGTLVDLFPDWSGETLHLYAVRPSRRLPSAKVEAFLRFFTEVCSEMTEGSIYTRAIPKHGTVWKQRWQQNNTI